MTASGLIEQLRERSPGVPLYLSVGTVAGRALAEEKLGSIVDGIFFAPLDYPFLVRRVLHLIRPAVVVILETEIWPALFREVKRAGRYLVVVNGRMSDRAFPRYHSWRFFFRNVLALPDAIFVQSEEDRRRYLACGAPPERLHVLGNLKYDVAPLRTSPPRAVTDLLDQLRPSAIWIAASTMPGADSSDVDEDSAVIAAFDQLAPANPGLLLILVPRKPERFDTAAELLRAAGARFRRRSRQPIDDNIALPCVLLLDSIGELVSLFPFADVVFMGGTLARRGGHNLLEPAAAGRAIISGPHLENFAGMAAEFRAHRAMREIAGPAELTGAVRELLGDAALRERLGSRAAEMAARHRGAARRAAEEILKYQDLFVPCGRPRGVLSPLPWLLSRIWIAAGKLKARRDLSRIRKLRTPVISIGAISMGGAGKTPMVDYLAERLHERGHNPAILTRGYRRRSIEPSILVEAGQLVPATVTGDEAQVYIHSGYAHAGIGADRWSTGTLIETKYQPDLFLLDDGFQHRKLARDLDVVLLDALNPFGAGAVFPLGQLREAPDALARAGALVIMRAAPEREYRGLIQQLRAINPHAPIFRARVQPRYWISHRTERLAHPPEGPVAAFCGLGNPASFWTTLKRARIHPVFTWSFRDHHRYRWSELERLAAQARLHGANILLCTEKDAANLPAGSLQLLMEDSVELYWLKIGLEIDNENELLELIESKLKR
jgi:3-deoxy-D-manno-octulosonic-acid transferase